MLCRIDTTWAGSEEGCKGGRVEWRWCRWDKMKQVKGVGRRDPGKVLGRRRETWGMDPAAVKCGAH